MSQLTKFAIVVDASKHLATPFMRPLRQCVESVIQNLFLSFPLCEAAFVLLQQSKAYLEVDFTNSQQQLMEPLNMDRITPAGVMSLSNGLKLLQNFNESITALLISFSPVTFDAENIFEIARNCQEKIILSTLSVGVDLKVLSTLSQMLNGFHFSADKFENLTLDYQQIFRFQSLATFRRAYLVNFERRQEFCMCHGRRVSQLIMCPLCNGICCQPGICKICGSLLLESIKFQKAKLQEPENQLNLVKLDRGECCGCGIQCVSGCSKCSRYICDDCADIFSQTRGCCVCKQ